MRFGRVFMGVLVVAALAGVSGCVQEPATPQDTRSTTTGSTSTSVPELTPSPSESSVPSTGSTPSPAESDSPQTTPAEADVQILDARFDAGTSQVSVAGMVVNVVSNAGLCSATATQNDKSFTASATSVADASVTYCASLVVPLPPGSTGEWIISLTFDEGATHGSTTSSVVVG